MGLTTKRSLGGQYFTNGAQRSRGAEKWPEFRTLLQWRVAGEQWLVKAGEAISISTAC
jgi:hypothetical protein